MTITEPGVYYDLPEKDYHAQTDWLSWSGMKHLLPPSTPAHFKAAQGQREERKQVFDFGKVVHALVLGHGAQYEVVQALNRKKEPYDATDYLTVSAREHRDAIYDRGNVPILRSELDQAEAMAAEVRAHKAASLLLTNGRPEVSLFWVDPGTKVKCRARIDWLPEVVEDRRMIVPDLKTAASAAPSEFAKAAANHGYYGQAVHYADGIKALGIDPDPAFVFVVIEKGTNFVQVGTFAEREDLRLARRAVDHCRRLYAECLANDHWPGYGDGVNHLELPRWLHYSLEEAIAS